MLSRLLPFLVTISSLSLEFIAYVILTVDSVTLKAMDGIIYGTIHPPRPTITPAGDEYEQVFKDLRVYKISIRKFSELKNATKRVKQETFTLTVPIGVRKFCVKVLPRLESRINKAEWSEEQCLLITTEQYFTVTNLSILVISMLLFCGILVCLVLQWYIRHPGKLPTVLVFKKPHDFFPANPLCPETPDAIHIVDLEVFPKVSLELRDSVLHGSTDSGFGSGKPSLQTEESQFLLPGSHPQIQGTLGKEESPGLQATCGDNTDSGICLQEPGLHSSMGPAWKQQLGYTHQDQDDSDVNLVQNSPGQPCLLPSLYLGGSGVKEICGSFSADLL